MAIDFHFKITSIENLLLKYVPNDWDRMQAMEFLQELPRIIDSNFRAVTAGKCDCGEELVCPECDIHPTADIDLNICRHRPRTRATG